MDPEYSQPNDAAAAAGPRPPHLARVIIWNMNHFGERTARNAERLNKKKELLNNLLSAQPDVVLLNEVNAGVNELQSMIREKPCYKFVPGPRMQALGTTNQGTQIEYFPLIYDVRKYELQAQWIATPLEFKVAPKELKWQKPTNRRAAAAPASAAVLPEYRPIVVYCLRLREHATEEHWYGAVHTTPDGTEFRRTSIFEDQVRNALAHISRAAHKRYARLFIGGDFYLTPEAVVVRDARNAERNVANPPTTAQFALTQALLDPDAILDNKPSWDNENIKKAIHTTVAAPVFETNRKGDHGQVADLAVVTKWPSHRALLHNFLSPARAQNVDTPTLRYSTPMYAVSDHLPVIFDLSARAGRYDEFKRTEPHPDAAIALRRTKNRALVLKTLQAEALRQAKASNRPMRRFTGQTYEVALAERLGFLKRADLAATLLIIDGNTHYAKVKALLEPEFKYALEEVDVPEFSVYDFETEDDYTGAQGAAVHRAAPPRRLIRLITEEGLSQIFKAESIERLRSAAPHSIHVDKDNRSWRLIGRADKEYRLQRAD